MNVVCKDSSTIVADMCDESKSSSLRKGNISWSPTEVGMRRVVSCPYAPFTTDRVFAYRDCLVRSDEWLNTTTIYWAEAAVDHCPDPPFSRAVEPLHLDLVVSVARRQLLVSCYETRSRNLNIFRRSAQVVGSCSASPVLIFLRKCNRTNYEKKLGFQTR